MPVMTDGSSLTLTDFVRQTRYQIDRRQRSPDFLLNQLLVEILAHYRRLHTLQENGAWWASFDATVRHAVRYATDEEIIEAIVSRGDKLDNVTSKNVEFHLLDLMCQIAGGMYDAYPLDARIPGWPKKIALLMVVEIWSFAQHAGWRPKLEVKP